MPTIHFPDTWDTERAAGSQCGLFFGGDARALPEGDTVITDVEEHADVTCGECKPLPMYVAGWNQPGALPDTAEPLPTFGSFNEAVRYLAAEVERHWDEDYQGAADADARLDIDGTYLEVHTALHNAPHTYEDGTHTFSEQGGKNLTYFIQPVEYEPAGGVIVVGRTMWAHECSECGHGFLAVEEKGATCPQCSHVQEDDEDDGPEA